MKKIINQQAPKQNWYDFIISSDMSLSKNYKKWPKWGQSQNDWQNAKYQHVLLVFMQKQSDENGEAAHQTTKKKL